MIIALNLNPAGFALENFDAIGAWREKYDKKLVVDPSGKLPSGKTFASNAEFRKLVVAQDETFARCLTKKLLTYAIGGQLNSGDRPSIDQISTAMADSDKDLRDLVHSIVLSRPFLHN
jgi:hypothetical protein